MAQFRGTIQGCRGAASRLGGKKSGLQVSANGWNIGIDVELYYDHETNKDIAVVSLTGGSNHGLGTVKEIGRFVEGEETVKQSCN